ncbi:Tigger transposable element-derived protein [Dirofilaria immitis]
MRRPRKHSASPLPSTAAASTAKTVNAVSKTGYKMTWKNAVLKIGRQKLVESVANNPEKRKSGKAVAIAVIDDDSSRAHLSKSSLLNKKKSISKVGKRARTAFFDSPEIKIARQIISSVKSDTEASPNSETNDGDRNDSNIYEIADQNDFAQNSSSSSVSSPIVSQLYLCKKEEQTGTDESVPLVSSSVSPQLCSCLSVMQQSSTVIDNSNKRMENVNEERENLLEETEMLECSTTNTNRELSEEEKHMVLADFDAGMLPHEIEEKYGVSKLQIADVLSNRISIFRTSWSDLFTLKRRRTVYVRLNMQMWNYFCQCRDQKIWLNGRQLKEQALKIAHELGLHSFKASEGWLDSFKRRHCIDLKAMTGKPVIYEADPEEANSVNDGLEIKISRSATPSPKLIRDTNSLSTVLDANKFLMDATDAAVLASTDRSDKNSSSSSVSSPIVSQLYLCKKEEQTGTDESVPLVSSSVSPQLCSCLSVMQQSSTVIDNSNKRMENVNEERENLLEETEMLECSTTNTNRELSEEEKHMVLADFDAGMLPHEIEEKYGVSKLQIADVLSNRISIFRTSWSDLFTLKRRRTVYVRLNMQMWNYFCQCRDQKIWLNGRQLKEQALKIAHELGLHSFKASEGWLDSFKRRHCIDLKAMTGKPVIYEADPEEANSVNDGLEIKISRSATPSPKLIRDTNSLSTVLDANKFLMDATDAAVLASTDRSDSDIAMTNPTQATVAIRTTSPLDIQRLLPGPSVVNEQNLLLPTVNTSEIAASSVQALLETCCYRVNEMEVAQAIDTLRAYIVSNNINLLPVLVELQKSLAAIAAQRKATEKISSRI